MRNIFEAPFVKDIASITANMYRLGWNERNGGNISMILEEKELEDYLDLTTGLLDGSIVGAYEETGFRKGDVARLGLAELWYQCDA